MARNEIPIKSLLKIIFCSDVSDQATRLILSLGLLCTFEVYYVNFALVNSCVCFGVKLSCILRNFDSFSVKHKQQDRLSNVSVFSFCMVWT